MKIAQLPSNIFNFFYELGLVGVLMLIALMGLVAAITVPIFVTSETRQIRNAHPIGSHVIIKGLGIEGTVSHYDPCGCNVEIMTLDKNGQISKITVDTKMIK